MPKLALVGDYNPKVPAHRAIPTALGLACVATGVKLEWAWIGTEKITDAARDLAGYSAVWVVPASPYKNMAGALAAIRYARENRLPFLGTCGGFQHALIEFARNVVQIKDADHAETAPAVSALSKPSAEGRVEGPPLVVTPLACSLVGQSGEISFTPGSLLHQIFQGQPAREEYHCRYGVNPAYRAQLESAGLRFTGVDANREIRAVELTEYPFFIGTLFQPERSALRGRHHPLIQAFVRAILR